jgi:hypothetical protein
MNLITAWRTAKEYQEVKLVINRHGMNSEVVLVKRGTFYNAIRKLAEFASEAEILSEGWSIDDGANRHSQICNTDV